MKKAHKPIPQLSGAQRAAFLAKIALGPGGCQLWTGRIGHTGYGAIHIDGVSFVAHRVSFTLAGGVIPPEFELDHLCRVRHCVNPEHLEPVPPKVNKMRSTSPAAQNARRTHCVNGHALSGENVYASATTKRTRRRCRACQREHSRVFDAKQRKANPSPIRPRWTGLARQGQAHPRAKLTDADVAAIRARHTAGEPLRVVAQAFGVSRSAVSRIVLGRRWGHLTAATCDVGEVAQG